LLEWERRTSWIPVLGITAGVVSAVLGTVQVLIGLLTPRVQSGLAWSVPVLLLLVGIAAVGAGWRFYSRVRLMVSLSSVFPSSLHQLPSDLADFTGREAQIKELLRQLSQSGGRVSLSSMEGLGGIGKTALAVHVAHKLKKKFPDAQLYINLRGGGMDPWGNPILEPPLTPVEALTRLVQPFHPEAKLPDDVDTLGAIFRDDLKGKRAFLLLDNAYDSAQVEPLCPDADNPHCAVLITSRQKIALPHLNSIDLDVMSPDESANLLREICGRISGQQGARIAQLCGFLPLALRLAGSTLAASRDMPVEEYVTALADEDKRLGLLQRGNKSVRAALNLRMRQLPGDVTLRWSSLSVFPGSFYRDAAAAVWELAGEEGEREARGLLAQLHRRNLVVYDQTTERYRLRDLLRLLAKEHLPPEAHTLAARRHAEHYVRVLAAADVLYLKGGESSRRGLFLFDLEWENITAGQAWAAAHVDTDANAARLCNFFPRAGAYCLDLRLHPEKKITWLNAAILAARRLKDKQAEGVHLGNLGNAYRQLGQTKRAIGFYDQVLPIMREIGDSQGEGNTLGNLGNAYAALGQPKCAIELYEQRLVIARETGDRRGEGNALGNLGLAYAGLGQPQRAIEFCEKALAISREIGDRHGEGQDLGNLGSAYADLGQPRRAIEYHEKALAVSREIGDRRGEGNALGNLGIAYRQLGQPKRAIEFYEQHLVITREIGDRRGEGQDLGNLGNVYAALGQPNRAMEFYGRQLVIARQIGDRDGEARASWNMGDEYRKQGNLNSAIELMQKWVDYRREIGHPDAEKDAAIVEDLRRQM